MASFYSHPSKSMAYVSAPASAPRNNSLTMEIIKRGKVVVKYRKKFLTLKNIEKFESLIEYRKNLHSEEIHTEDFDVVSKMKSLHL